jgi:hypothetical protein
VTAWQVIVGLVLALGGVVWAVAKADLEDPELYRWLTRKLIYRAALRLPRGERARWRAEAMQNVLDLPGRLLPLWWALDTYARSGRWGRERGAPSRWQALVARGRAAWHRLRSLPGERAKARSKERHPAFPTRARAQVEAELAQAVVATVTGEATVTARSTTRSTGRATLGPPPGMWATSDGWRDGKPHLSDREFVAWLGQERQAFSDDLDRRVEAWRQSKTYRQAEAWRQRQA